MAKGLALAAALLISACATQEALEECRQQMVLDVPVSGRIVPAKDPRYYGLECHCEEGNVTTFWILRGP